MTEEDDIGFAVYYDNKSEESNDLAEMEPVFPYIRLECSKVPLSGSIICENTGRCKYYLTPDQLSSLCRSPC